MAFLCVVYSGMIFVDDVIVADDIPLARFSCNTGACKGACCVVGSAGAPVRQSEIPVLNKAWRLLKDELPPASREAVIEKGLVRASSDGDYELSTIGDAECVFVKRTSEGVAICAIQEAHQQGRFQWPKPISCHLFPIRETRLGAVSYLNFEYVPEICEPAVTHARANGHHLSDMLAEPLARRFGAAWVRAFLDACRQAREGA